MTQLKYFQALAQRKSFTQTAQDISVSQSALSRSIAKLEQEIGTPLLNRQGKQTILTEAGEKLLFHVNRSIRELDIALREISAVTEGESIVRVSFLHSLGETILPEILSSFHGRYPQIQIKLNQQNSDVLAEQLSEGEADICLCSMLNGENIAWMYLCSEEIFLAVPHDHPLARKEIVYLQEIDDAPFITLKPEYGLRQQINQFLDLAESTPHVIFEGDEVQTLTSLVAAGLGVSLIPHIPCMEQRGVCFVPIAFPTCQRSVGIAWNAKNLLSPAAVLFQQFTINLFSSNAATLPAQKKIARQSKLSR